MLDISSTFSRHHVTEFQRRWSRLHGASVYMKSTLSRQLVESRRRRRPAPPQRARRAARMSLRGAPGDGWRHVRAAAPQPAAPRTGGNCLLRRALDQILRSRARRMSSHRAVVPTPARATGWRSAPRGGPQRRGRAALRLCRRVARNRAVPPLRRGQSCGAGCVSGARARWASERHRSPGPRERQRLAWLPHCSGRPCAFVCCFEVAGCAPGGI